APWSGSCTRQVSVTSRSGFSPSRSSTGPSTNGGSPSRSASARRGRTCRDWQRTRETGCASGVASCTPTLRSPSRPARGPRAAWRERAVARTRIRLPWPPMALEVGIVGLPNSGKTTLFNALTRAGAEITAYASVTDKPNVGMAAIADERLGRLAELVHAKKVTPAAIRVVDVRGTGPQLLGNLRQVDAILAVLDGFSEGATPEDDLETLKLELLVADRDHVERRHERVQKEAKSGDAAKRSEAETLTALLAHLD